MTPSTATRTKLAQLHPDLARRVEALILAAPFRIGITSAWRSSKRQAELYRLFLAGKGNPANRPGTSKHEREIDGRPAAEAADLNYGGSDEAQRWAHRHAARFGLHFPIRSEDWHVESNGKPFTPEEPDMTPEQERKLNEVHQMLTALGAPRRPDHKDRDTSRIDLGDALTVLTREIRAVAAKVDKITGGK